MIPMRSLLAQGACWVPIPRHQAASLGSRGGQVWVSRSLLLTLGGVLCTFVHIQVCASGPCLLGSASVLLGSVAPCLTLSVCVRARVCVSLNLPGYVCRVSVFWRVSVRVCAYQRECLRYTRSHLCTSVHES